MKFLVDWHTRNFPHLEKILEPLKEKPSHFLEIGALEGGTTCWLLQNFPKMIIQVIDNFSGCEQYPDTANLMNTFWSNVSECEDAFRVFHSCGWSHKHIRSDCSGYDSFTALQALNRSQQRFDAIYVDANHASKNVMEDTLLSWPLLQPGGVMIWDDYDWGTVSAAVNWWMAYAEESFTVLEVPYWQYAVRKK